MFEPEGNEGKKRNTFGLTFTKLLKLGKGQSPATIHDIKFSIEVGKTQLNFSQYTMFF
jgi:hypothetical protein